MSFFIEDRGNGITWVQIDSRNIYTMSKWCQETGCGKQVNHRAISFKNEAELTMFLMRWQGEQN